jgi:hypothetical protein
MNVHIRRYGVLLLAALLVAFAVPAFAQEATIVGTVTDPTGAVIPNVTITIANTETGQTRNIASNEAGQFVVPNLRIGNYTVKAESSGFKTETKTGIVLNVGDRIRIDFQMQVGETRESVSVAAEAVRVQSDSSEVSDVISGKQVSQLAVNSRNLYQLVTLTPGVSSELSSDYNAPIPVGSNANQSFNGQRPDHNNWLIDGGESYDRGSGGKSAIMPSIDAIAEFRALTSNYTAEYGLNSGGTVVMVFKSGTKDFHGTLWEFFRNDALDATPYFINLAGGKKPPFRFNTYGFNIGGPVVLPGYNKERNKTFFFYNMEWRKIRQQTVVTPNTAPNAWRNGDFSSLLPATQLHVPANISPALTAKFAAAGLHPGDPFPNNQIPSSLFDANALAFLKSGALPLPTSGDKFIGTGSAPTDVREELVRVDHQFSEKFSVFGHWVSEAINQNYATSMWSGDSYPTIGNTFGNPSFSGVVRATYIISPSLVNETSFNYNGNRINITPVGVYKRTSDFNVPELYSSNNLTRFPTINWQKQLNTAYDSASWPWKNKADDYQVRNDFSWTHGRHSFKFGGQYMRYNKLQDLFGNTQGNFNFDGHFTGADFSDFLLGLASNYSELAVQDSGRWDNNSFSLYGQDTWRVNNRLTLNLGLRWDGMPHAFEENNRMSNFYPNLYNPAQAPTYLADGSLNPAGPGFKTVSGVPLSSTPFYMNGIAIAGQGVPTGLVKNFWNNWGPRVGFAYDVTGNGKTVVRGGFGIMYERVQGNDVYNGGGNPPFSFNPSITNVLFSSPTTSIATGQTATAPIYPGQVTGLAYSNYKAPTSNQWSFGVQRELWPRAVLSVSYVGNVNSHQNIYRNVNLPLLSDPRRADVVSGKVGINDIRPFLGFSDIRLSENSEGSWYNSLQTNFRMDVTHGLSLQFAYTYAKAMDYGGTGVGGGDLNNASNPFNLRYDLGPAAMDRTHIAVMNYVYDLPIFKNTTNKALRNTLGGWQLSGISTFETGFPLTPGMPLDNLGLGNTWIANRPDVIGALTYPHTRLQWFSTSSFAAPTGLNFGNAGKGIIRGPGRQNWDMSLFKTFAGIPWFGNPEGARFEFRFETFNSFNHTQFNGISTSKTAGDFGQVTSAFSPRTMQLGLKFIF